MSNTLKILRFFTTTLLSLMMFCNISIAHDTKIINMTSLEWPPYTGEALPDKGANAAVLKAAFEAMGYSLNIKMLPWERAVNEAQNNPDYVGYFPEYFSSDVEKNFIFSDPIGHGPLGFVENKDNPVIWNKLEDLKNISIGVVNGYVNTSEFDDMVAKKQLNVYGVSEDRLNVRLVANGRLRLAVIDPNVLNYLLISDSTIKDLTSKLQFNAKIMEDKKLYVAFNKSDAAQNAKKILDEGLKKIDIEAITQAHFKALNMK